MNIKFFYDDKLGRHISGELRENKKFVSVTAIRPQYGNYKTPPPPLKIILSNIPEDPSNPGDYKLKGEICKSYCTIEWQPEDDPVYKEKREGDIIWNSVTVWVKFSDYPFSE